MVKVSWFHSNSQYSPTPRVCNIWRKNSYSFQFLVSKTSRVSRRKIAITIAVSQLNKERYYLCYFKILCLTHMQFCNFQSSNFWTEHWKLEELDCILYKYDRVHKNYLNVIIVVIIIIVTKFSEQLWIVESLEN